MSIYSHTFHRHVGIGPWTWTCPTGNVAVVKYASAINLTAGPGQVIAYANDTMVWLRNVPVNDSAFAAGLHIVLDEGEVLKVVCSASPFHCYVGGYLLSDAYQPGSRRGVTRRELLLARGRDKDDPDQAA
jgi:hypothetical protein